MSVVKINVVTMPPDKWERFEERFRGRAGAVETTPGFEWFELLRPVEGTDAYLVYTRWSSQAAYEAWQTSQDFDRAHDGGGDTLAPAAERSQQHVWSYEVIQSAGPAGQTA
ncbi:antibiotic biosynthesis monooxygenase family protein [Modestobacter marinus]|uniref:antibiotic biosynthesis monooxygenase family protein n=1 Tax=Modestobacter marinus TaxID=477641 RepID=UPI001C9880E3|nr:antibiotic biosynthesis monooxygenase [Modestobacter marinus]